MNNSAQAETFQDAIYIYVNGSDFQTIMMYLSKFLFVMILTVYSCEINKNF